MSSSTNNHGVQPSGAKPMHLWYRHAYREFWCETKSVLCVNDIVKKLSLQNALKSFMDNTRDEDVAVVSALRIHREVSVHFTFVGNTWYGRDLCGMCLWEMVMVPPAKAKAIFAADFRTCAWGDPVSGARVEVRQLDWAQKSELFRLAGRRG